MRTVGDLGAVPRTGARRGTWLTVLGTLCLVPDTTLVRMVDAPSTTTAMWRGLLVAAAIGSVLAARYGSAAPGVVRATGLPGAVSAALWSTTTVLMVLAVDHTTIANVLVIIATAPMLAALLTRFVLRERLALRTWIAMPVALGGVALAFSSAAEGASTTGDLCAAGVALAVAVNLTVLRHHREVDMVPAGALGGFVTFLVLAMAGTPWGLAASDVVPLVAMAAVFVPAGLVLVTTGTRHLSSPEVALILLLETILGPVLGLVAVGDPIGARTLLGGAVVIVTLAVHSLVPLLRAPGESAS